MHLPLPKSHFWESTWFVYDSLVIILMNASRENSDQYLKSVLLRRNLLRFARSVTLAELAWIICDTLKPKFPRILSIVGGAASGKSTLTSSLADALRNSGTDPIAVLSTDDYSIGTRSFRENQLGSIDPNIIHDFRLLSKNVERICTLEPGEQLTIPKYNPSNGAGISPSRVNATEVDTGIYLTVLITGLIQLIIVEGDFQPLAKTDYVIYLHLSDKARLENRINRDTQFRNYQTKSSVIKSFMQRQTSQHNLYTLPVAKKANAIIWSNPRRHNDQTTYMYDLFLEKY